MPTDTAPVRDDADLDRYADLETALTRLVRRTHLPTAGEAPRRAAGVTLERATYATLVRVTELDGGRLSDVAAVLGLDVSTTSRHVKRLVDAGYVDATTDPDDARAKRFATTPSGTDVLRRVRDARRAHLAHALSGWDAGAVTDLAHGLDRLVTALEDDERAP